MQVELSQGVKIGYRSRGEGFPLIMITGFGATMDLWSEKFIATLSERYRVIIFDNRGSGESEAPLGPITIVDFAQDAVGLMDKLGLPKAHILGISMGGMIAQQLAVSYPERVAKLILGATSCASKYIKKDPALLGLFTFRIFPRFAMRSLISREFIEKNPEAVQRVIDYAQKSPTNWKALRLQSAAIRGYDLSEKIKNIKLPTLVIGGTDDHIINPENSDIIAARIAGAKQVKLTGAGHLFPLERLSETTRAILDFLDE